MCKRELKKTQTKKKRQCSQEGDDAKQKKKSRQLPLQFALTKENPVPLWGKAVTESQENIVHQPLSPKAVTESHENIVHQPHSGHMQLIPQGGMNGGEAMKKADIFDFLKIYDDDKDCLNNYKNISKKFN